MIIQKNANKYSIYSTTYHHVWIGLNKPLFGGHVLLGKWLAAVAKKGHGSTKRFRIHGDKKKQHNKNNKHILIKCNIMMVTCVIYIYICIYIPYFTYFHIWFVGKSSQWAGNFPAAFNVLPRNCSSCCSMSTSSVAFVGLTPAAAIAA